MHQRLSRIIFCLWPVVLMGFTDSKKPISRPISLRLLLLVLMAVGSPRVNVQAQSQPVFLRLKGVGIGSNVTGIATDVQVVGNFAYLAWGIEWGGDTNHPGGLEIFSVTNPAAPVQVSGYTSILRANAVQVVGQYAYLAEGTSRTFTNDPGAFEI